MVSTMWPWWYQCFLHWNVPQVSEWAVGSASTVKTRGQAIPSGDLQVQRPSHPPVLCARRQQPGGIDSSNALWLREAPTTGSPSFVLQNEPQRHLQRWQNWTEYEAPSWKRHREVKDVSWGDSEKKSKTSSEIACLLRQRTKGNISERQKSCLSVKDKSTLTWWNRTPRFGVPSSWAGMKLTWVLMTSQKEVQPTKMYAFQKNAETRLLLMGMLTWSLGFPLRKTPKETEIH